MVVGTIQPQLTCKNAQSADQWIPVMGVLLGLLPPPTWSSIRDRSLFIGVGGDLGLNKAKFSRFPLWLLFYRSDPPPNNFWWLSRSPTPCLHFPSKFEWSPLWILPKFSAIPPIGFSVTTDPPFCSPKNQVTPPPLQVINNDRSLMSSLVCSREKCRLISRTAAGNELLSRLFWDSLEIELTVLLPLICTSH